MPATIHHVGVAAAMEKCAVCAVVLYSFSSRLWLGNPLRTRWAEKVVFDFAFFLPRGRHTGANGSFAYIAH
jgi:hypothetical protein